LIQTVVALWIATKLDFFTVNNLRPQKGLWTYRDDFLAGSAGPGPTRDEQNNGVFVRKRYKHLSINALPYFHDRGHCLIKVSNRHSQGSRLWTQDKDFGRLAGGKFFLKN
jgi:hypothetical protein